MHGLSTLNRLLGKKQKQGSRSSSNLSKSTSNLDTSSQHNKITPIVVNNAPFEQTFRVTVYLPKNQLYVERIGAKTKLSTLLERICENKHLVADKVEFRHPGDMSQVFDNDKTIGEVGLNELKLVLKTESHFNTDFRRFHGEDIIKYKSTVPESVSSSEISRNYNKKLSPYSSTTSLNSLDSTGMNITAKAQPPVAPARKKRVAPRPPSQSSIPEQEIFIKTLNVFKEPHSILPMKNFHTSSPQLNNSHMEIKSDKNNNIEQEEKRLNAITRPASLYLTSTKEIDQNSDEYLQQSLHESSDVKSVPRERQNSNSFERNKKKPAPVPPKRIHKPVPSSRTIQDESKSTTITEIKEINEQEKNDKVIESKESMSEKENITENGNVSKIFLNNTQRDDETSVVDSISDEPISIQITSNESSIEPMTEKVTAKNDTKLPSSVSKVHIKVEDDNNRRSSSEDEMTVNIYNVTNSVVKVEKSNDAMKIIEEERKDKEIQVSHDIQERPTSPLWTYTLPAPPVLIESNVNNKSSPTDRKGDENKFFSDFVSTDCNETILSDSNTTIVSAETHIQPIIVDRNIVRETNHGFETSPTPTDFKKNINDDESSEKSTEVITSDLEDGYLGNGKTIVNVVTMQSPTLNEKKIEQKNEITIESFQRSRLLISRSDSFHSVGQARKSSIDSPLQPGKALHLPQRSTSFLSLIQSQKSEAEKNIINSTTDGKNEMANTRQKSTSELSISDVPLLQSIEVLKNILNSSSRKESLTNEVTKASNDKENTSAVSETTYEIVKKEIKIQESPNVVENKVQKIAVPEDVVPREPTKPAENQWRYSGPPKINLSTWNERPTSKVIIAADSDYKFGGVKNHTSSEINNTQQQKEKKEEEKLSKRYTIHITDETTIKKEAEKHLPKVLGVEYKKDVPSSAASTIKLRDSSADYVTKSPSRTTIINIKPRPMSMEMNNNYSTLVTSNERSPTLQSPSSSIVFNRLNSNGKKFTPIVHGFKLNNIRESEHADVSSNHSNTVRKDIERVSVVPPNVPAKPAFLRSTSAGDISRSTKLSVAEIQLENNNSSTTSSALDFPFSQKTLRRTGLKEKILSNDKETKSMFGKVVDPEPETFIRKKSDNDEIVQKTVIKHLSQPVPVPPKPPKAPSMIMRKSEPVTEMETRNQLLDAIKNFNKDSLRRK